MQARTEWSEIISVEREKKKNISGFLYPEKLLLKSKGQIKTFSPIKIKGICCQ